MTKAHFLRTPPPSELISLRAGARVFKRFLFECFLLAFSAAAHAQFTYTTYNGAVNITGFSGNATDLTIPETIEGMPVVGIGSAAFSSKTEVKSVTIPNSMLAIEASAFRGCTSLVGITIPDSVTYIGESAFEGCTALASVHIGNGVVFLGNRDVGARYGYSGAFFECPNLAEITVGSLNTSFSSIDGVLFNKSQSELLRYPMGSKSTDYTVPASVTSIVDFAFYGSHILAHVVLPGALTNIGYSGLAKCNNLRNCTIPSGVTSIKGGTFDGCTRLKNVVMSSNVTAIESRSFSSCGLTTLAIPMGTTNIGEAAFFGCDGLSSVTIPKTVVNLGAQAFGWCRFLRRAYFQTDLTSIKIDPTAFYPDAEFTMFYPPWAKGWPSVVDYHLTAVFDHQVSRDDGSLGVEAGRFGFNIVESVKLTAVVEACDDLSLPVWLPVSTNTIASGSSYFTDSAWTNKPSRFYRFRSP